MSATDMVIDGPQIPVLAVVMIQMIDSEEVETWNGLQAWNQQTPGT